MFRSVYIFFVFWMLVNLRVCGQVTYHEILAQALRFQMQADSLQRLLEAQALAISTAPDLQKNRIRNAIREHEALAVALQKRANEWFIQAAAFELYAMDSDHVSTFESEFAILPNSPYSAAHPAPVDEPLTDGVFYKIQLGVFRNPVATNAFRGLTPISGETLDNGFIRYYAGLFYKYVDADAAVRKVHEYGFREAYIVAFYNRKTISIVRARQLEAGY